MFKANRLLKVVSIIMIIFVVIGIIAVAFTYAMIPKLESVLPEATMELYKQSMTPLNLVISLVSSISGLVAAIAALSGKSFKIAAIAMGIYTLITVVSSIQSIMMVGMQFTIVLSFILPILYWWGLYQSKE